MKKLKPILQKIRGITLTEVMVVIAIIGILAAIAVPTFNEQMQQQRVVGAAEGLVAALQNAKAEAIKNNRSVRIVFTPATTGADLGTWCYGMVIIPDATPTTTCNCTVANSCLAGSVVQSTDYTGITVNFNTSNSRVFSPLRGTVTSGTIRFSAGNNKTLGITTTTLGRIRICKDSTSIISSYTDSGDCP